MFRTEEIEKLDKDYSKRKFFYTIIGVPQPMFKNAFYLRPFIWNTSCPLILFTACRRFLALPC